MTLEEYAKIATSANEQPRSSETLGRYEDEKLGWMTLYLTHDGEVRYVRDKIRAFDGLMKDAQKRHKKERRRLWE